MIPTNTVHSPKQTTTSSIGMLQDSTITNQIITQAVINELKGQRVKIDPQQWLMVCHHAIEQNTQLPEKTRLLTSDTFKEVCKIAQPEPTSFTSFFTQPFIHLLSISYICLKGRDAFIRSGNPEHDEFDHENFIKWLSTKQVLIQENQLNKSDLKDIKMNANTGDISFGNAPYSLNVDDPIITHTFPHGKYVGEFVNNEAHGEGTLTLNNNRKLQGTFENDEFKNGTITYPNGIIASGKWREGHLIEGSFYNPADNTTYNGNFAPNFQKEGYGMLTTPAKAIRVGNNVFSMPATVFCGTFANNRRFYGVNIYSTGLSMEGDYSSGSLNGSGKMFFVEGSPEKFTENHPKLPCFEANFKNGIFQSGFGKFTDEDGVIYEGHYENIANNPVKHGTGKYTFTDGSILGLNYINGEIKGTVNYTLPDGKNLEFADIDEMLRYMVGGYLQGNIEGDLANGLCKNLFRKNAFSKSPQLENWQQLTDAKTYYLDVIKPNLHNLADLKIEAPIYDATTLSAIPANAQVLVISNGSGGIEIIPQLYFINTIVSDTKELFLTWQKSNSYRVSPNRAEITKSNIATSEQIKLAIERKKYNSME